MDEFLNRIADGIAARIDGPMSFRFILQPLVAVALGIRDGIHDAKAGEPPLIANLIFDSKNRTANLKGAWRKVRMPILIGAILDAVAQYLIFHHIRAVPALVVGVGVIALPYSIARGLTNRFVSARMKRGERGDVS